LLKEWRTVFEIYMSEGSLIWMVIACLLTGRYGRSGAVWNKPAVDDAKFINRC